MPVEQLLREADIVSLLLRLSADTQGLSGNERPALMKPTAFLTGLVATRVVAPQRRRT